MRTLSVLLAFMLATTSLGARAAVSDPAIFSALESAGPAGSFTAISDGERVVILPVTMPEVEVCATAHPANAASLLGHLAITTVAATTTA